MNFNRINCSVVSVVIDWFVFSGLLVIQANISLIAVLYVRVKGAVRLLLLRQHRKPIYEPIITKIIFPIEQSLSITSSHRIGSICGRIASMQTILQSSFYSLHFNFLFGVFLLSSSPRVRCSYLLFLSANQNGGVVKHEGQIQKKNLYVNRTFPRGHLEDVEQMAPHQIVQKRKKKIRFEISVKKKK